MIKAHEIQGVLALENSSIAGSCALVNVASTAVVSYLMGGNREQMLSAFPTLGGWPALRTYRHAPNAGSRKSGRQGTLPAGLCALRILLRGE